MITPSIKALRTLTPCADKAKELKRILTMRRIELEALPAGADRIHECYHTPSTADLRMTCLDAALGTYGVESFQTRKGEWVDYLNTGDPYTPTIVRWRGNYRVTDWGSIAERHA
jgi:hypothetical protein